MVGRDLGGIYDRAPAIGRETGRAGRLGSDRPRTRRRWCATCPSRCMRAKSSASAASSAPGVRRRWRRSSASARAAPATITVGGKIVDPKKPAQAVRAGIGFVAEDRRSQNIVPDLSVQGEPAAGPSRRASRASASATAAGRRTSTALLASLGLPADRLLDANMLNFSGGMQQKIIIARWLLLNPKVLILDEPTKGVDIGTRQSIYQLLRDVAAKGVAVVVVSSDFEELIGLSDRIVVISDGASIADLSADLLDEEKLTLLAAPRTSMARNTEMLRNLAPRRAAPGSGRCSTTTA